MLRLAIRAFAGVTLLAVLGVSISPLPAFAGTTGGITGRVVDSQSQAPLADVTVTAISASQSATSVTDATGNFRFLSLSPDTYTLQFKKSGYDELSQAGITIFADQVEALTISLARSIKTIAKTTSRSAGSLVKAGSTSDVYSVNASTAAAAQSLLGPGSLNSAYGAIASVPGVSVDGGETGWFQTVHIRGGDIDQVGYELDGIPVNRAYDNAPMTMLSSLGQQELQVYTGGTPASSDAQGISGYVNQVVKTGTYPGYGSFTGGIGFPAFYHKLSAEAGGSTPDRRFSYYVGIGAANQDFRYWDENNGANSPYSFFYPMNTIDANSFTINPNNGYVYTGGSNPGYPLFVAGNAFGIASSQQRDVLANFHFALPHKSSSLRDDVQLLYLNSEVFAQYYSSQNDLGPSVVNALGQLTWDDSATYTGSLWSTVNPALIQPYYFPGSPTNRANNWVQGQTGGASVPLPANQRDANDNGVSVVKLQYQHAFSSSAFLRIYGYSLYSNWFINGPNTAAQPYYGAELADYEIPDHTFGYNLSFTDQLNDKHLLTASTNFTGSNLQRYDVGYINGNYQLTNFVVGSNPSTAYCADPTSGAQVPCYPDPGLFNAKGGGYANSVGGCGTAGFLPAGVGTLDCPMPVAPAAGVNGNWLATNNTFFAPLNQVRPRFTGFSITDEWRPSDTLSINLGLRIENFKYLLGDTGANDPARTFWFTQYNQDYCVTSPTSTPFWNGLGGCPVVNGVQSYSPGIVNSNLSSYSVTRWQPRFGFTYTMNPDTVLRGSAGVYARPPNSSWVQYNVAQGDLPSYLGAHFYSYGFNSPDHLIRPDTSYNYDLSLEKHFKGTDITMKLTPFYRATRDQLQNFFIDPQGGLESGLNVGNQRSEGVEFAIQKGDFSKDGWSGQLSYTYTNSKIRYQDFPGTSTNVIDQLNQYIQAYNSYTAGCAGVAGSSSKNATCGAAGGANASPLLNGITNPYYCPTTSSSCPWATQPLLDDTAYYTTYDVIPGPFAGVNGYAVPHVLSLLLNYRKKNLDVTVPIEYSSGASYGAPTVWPGYMPQTCAPIAGSTNADTTTCTDNGGLPLFLPDPYNNYHYDSLGQFKQPWRFTASLSLSYDFSPRITGSLLFSNIIDTCGQRGYAWDNPYVCTYGNLPSSVLAPGGNFYPNVNGNVPAQLQYPYTFWLNNNNTGFLGVRVPMQITGNVQIKL